MKTKHLPILLIVLVLILVLAGNALAMSSPNYRLDWFVGLSGGGGGPASSTSYAANFTVGQVVAGPSSSVSYKVGLGYWYGVGSPSRAYLPLILK
jgi:hypothetical protein